MRRAHEILKSYFTHRLFFSIDFHVPKFIKIVPVLFFSSSFYTYYK